MRNHPYAPWKYLLATLPFALGAIGTRTAAAAPTCAIDQQGADDEPGQKDLSSYCSDKGGQGFDLSVTWQWDDTSLGGGNTFDACTFLDKVSDADVYADYALCLTLDANGVITDTRLFSCNNTKRNTCPQSVEIMGFASTCTIGSGGDPFNNVVRVNNACSGNDCLNKDTAASCTIQFGDFSGPVRLTETCSQPSSSPTSDPSDCVITERRCVPSANDDSNCNGLDDDCDGSIDEDFVPHNTTCGVGACAGTGQTQCINGEEVNTCQPGQPALNDPCDGIDNDCDGSTDEDFIPQNTSCGVGACAATGQTACVNGGVVNTCTPGVPALTDPCDGIDNDCDGSTDEDFGGMSTTCGVGGCAAAGETQCVNGQVVDTCQPGEPAPSDAVCNGVDDDCDGGTDEDFVSTPTTCGSVACPGTGHTECNGGQEVDTCVSLGFCVCAYTQGAWGSTCNGQNIGCTRDGGFASVYPNGLDVGHQGANYNMLFTSSAAVRTFLPQGATPAVLTKNYVNPGSKNGSGTGAFGGNTTALRLNVDYDDAGRLARTGTTPLANFVVTQGPFTGLTVRQLLALAEDVIGGNVGALPPGTSVPDLNAAVDAVNNNFDNCTTDHGFLAQP